MFLVNNFHLLSGLFLSSACLLQTVRGIMPLGEITPADPKFPVGGNLTLTCNMTNYFGPLDSSSLYFVYGRNKIDTSPITSQFYLVVSPTAIRLTIPFVSHRHQNLYRCFINNTNQSYVASTRVRIGSLPEKITEIQAVFRNLRVFNVTWCTKNIVQDLVNYELNWTTANWGHLDSCPMQEKTGTRCYSCIWNNNPFQGTYYLVIRGSSIYGTTYSNFTIDAMAHVKPDPVSDLVIEPLNSTSVRAKWKRPPNLAAYLPLNFTLTYMKKPYSPIRSVLVEENDSVVLADFCPGATYTFAIQCIPGMGGVMSDETKIDFKAPDDVPAIAPAFPPGWFHSPWCLYGTTSDLCSLNYLCQSVIFYWQPIPEHLRNGEILGYHVQYESPDGNRSIQANSTSVHVLLVRQKNHVLRLSAFTSAGSSKTHSIVFHSNCHEMPKPVGLFAETTPNKSGVVLQWNRVNEATNYSLLYCQGKDRTCFCDPMLKVISPDQTNITLLNVTEHIFALAVNTEQGTSGLSWICLFDYDGPALAPKSVKVESQEGKTVLLVKWHPATCDELPNSGNRPGRIHNYTVTYRVTGADKEKSMMVPGNTTQCFIHLSIGVNYTISVRGNTRAGQGQVTTIYHLLSPSNTGVFERVLSAAIPCLVIVVFVLAIAFFHLRRKYKEYCHPQVKIPIMVRLDRSLHPEPQENTNYNKSIDGYALVTEDPAQLLQGSNCAEQSIDLKQTSLNMELIPMLDSNDNLASYNKAQGCSFQPGRSSTVSTPTEELKGTSEVETYHCNSSETAYSQYTYYPSNEMGYASANMASQVVLLGPPQPVNCDSFCDDTCTLQLIGSEKVAVKTELQDSLQQSLPDTKQVIQGESPSTSSVKTNKSSSSDDYSKASIAI